jgi:hypothetical protein
VVQAAADPEELALLRRDTAALEGEPPAASRREREKRERGREREKREREREREREGERE